MPISSLLHYVLVSELETNTSIISGHLYLPKFLDFCMNISVVDKIQYSDQCWPVSDVVQVRQPVIVYSIYDFTYYQINNPTVRFLSDA